MRAFVFPLLAFVLWELPSMIVMSLHKLICALTGRSLAGDFLGVWAYRLVGMLFFWPVVIVSLGLAAGEGWVGGLGRFLLLVETLSAIGLLLWSRVSTRGT